LLTLYLYKDKNKYPVINQGINRMTNKISKKGIDLIKKYEGLRLKSYVCAAGVLTIGWGSTGSHVTPHMVISEAEAERLLIQDLARFESGVNRLVKRPITQNQFDALVSLAFNIGLGAFSNSTLLRRLNAGDFQGASEQFARWNRGGGKVLRGLTVRRAEETAMFRGAW
jgi:lysozyme